MTAPRPPVRSESLTAATRFAVSLGFVDARAIAAPRAGGVVIRSSRAVALVQLHRRPPDPHDVRRARRLVGNAAARFIYVTPVDATRAASRWGDRHGVAVFVMHDGDTAVPSNATARALLERPRGAVAVGGPTRSRRRALRRRRLAVLSFGGTMLVVVALVAPSREEPVARRSPRAARYIVESRTCEQADGVVRAAGTITNTSERPRSYWLRVEFRTDRGTTTSAVDAIVPAVAPSDVAEWEAFGITDPATSPACVVADVDAFDA